MKRKLFRKPSGKLTEEKCPVCLEVQMRLARGYVKCPVCDFKRKSAYYLDLLASLQEVKDNAL